MTENTRRIICLALAIIIAVVANAFASPDTSPKHLTTRPETAIKAKRPIVRCIPPSIFILAQRLPDGRRVPVAMIVSPGTC